MLQDNPLLAQLKQQLHAQTPRVEGVVKGTDKNFGFLEVESQKSYFIPPPQMKKVMHGDKITAAIHTDKEREIAEPESLIDAFLTRFVGRIQKKENDDRLSIIPDHPMLKEAISCRPAHDVQHAFQHGDWAVAEMRRHPLNGDRGFFAEITQHITHSDDDFAPWWVTLARNNLPNTAPTWPDNNHQLDDGLPRQDLSALPFVTIDSASTEDMDDALHVEEKSEGTYLLSVAIADPTAYISPENPLDSIARERAFTTYLPGFDIPMLPRELSDNICSLRPHVRRPALVCQFTVQADGAIADETHFFTAWIESKAKLAYDDVSNWLENRGNWQPASDDIAQQITRLHHVANARSAWRQQHALIFKERPDYRFILGEKGRVLDIVAEPRRVANRIVEECMIAANICAANVLRDQLGFAIYNVHTGFDPALVEQAVTLLKAHDIDADANQLLTLEGFCQLRRLLDSLPNAFLDSRIRRLQTFAEIRTEPGPHFGLGLPAYATWTSPIRKYGDMVNHRLLKAMICQQSVQRPDDELTLQLTERRRQNRMAERDVADWLYARFLQDKVSPNHHFPAEIIDISRGGMRVRLLDNGAVAFIPASLLHPVREELVCSQETGSVQIKGEAIYRQGDSLIVHVQEVRIETRHIIAKPVTP